jgi:2-oxoglutarate ferredoxin oxidoreductase subunit gamma
MSLAHATIFGGFGGQGLLFAGQALAEAAMLEFIVADHAIGSPIVDLADSVIALNPPSMAKFEPLLRPGGLLILNSSIIEAEPRRLDVEIVSLPCTALAREAGHERLASVVALGGLIARRQIVSPDSIRDALVGLTGAHHPELLEADLRAFASGFEQSRLLEAG